MNAVIATAMARRLMASMLAKTRYAAERKEAERPTKSSGLQRAVQAHALHMMFAAMA